MIEKTTNFKFLDVNGARIAAEPPRLLTEGDGCWVVNNSPLSDYSERARFFGRPRGLLEILDGLPDPDASETKAGLEIAAGSNAVALRRLMACGYVDTALATNYEDLRDDYAIREKNLDHVDGNIVDKSVWERIADWQRSKAPNGIRIVMHRPVGGLQQFAPDVYLGAAHHLLDITAGGGLFFTQIPRALRQEKRELRRVCDSLRARDDVRRVIISAPAPRHSLVDYSDLFVAFLK